MLHKIAIALQWYTAWRWRSNMRCPIVIWKLTLRNSEQPLLLYNTLYFVWNCGVSS